MPAVASGARKAISLQRCRRTP